MTETEEVLVCVSAYKGSTVYHKPDGDSLTPACSHSGKYRRVPIERGREIASLERGCRVCYGELDNDHSTEKRCPLCGEAVVNNTLPFHIAREHGKNGRAET